MIIKNEEDEALAFLMSPKQYEDYKAKVKAIEKATACIEKPALPVKSSRVLDRERIVDQYELRYMTRKDIKKIPVEDLEALIVYWNIYTRNFDNGKFDNGKYGSQFSFKEAEVNHKVKDIVCAMEQELRKRL